MGIDFEGLEWIQNLDFGFRIKDKDKEFRIFGLFGGNIMTMNSEFLDCSGVIS